MKMNGIEDSTLILNYTAGPYSVAMCQTLFNRLVYMLTILFPPIVAA
jgi:hypothetical protein